MTHAPGPPEEKQVSLGKLTADLLPHLVADVLFFHHDHTQIRVTDGPGDGRRDIHSITPAGKKHLTQCKFHGRSKATVGSRETDELVIAMAKFGAKAGTFATNARLSPQAKREYLDNFPGYELGLLEGVDLANAVLGHPSLAALWLHDGRLADLAKQVAMPVLVRDARSDRPVSLRELLGIAPPAPFGKRLERKIADRFVVKSAKRSSNAFVRYRPPKLPTLSEAGDSFFYCDHVLAEHAHELPGIRTTILDLILGKADELSGWTIRFGTPVANPISDDLDDGVELTAPKPSSYLFSGRKCSPERDWLLVTDPGWVFPHGFGTLQADWADWYSASEDTAFRVYLASPHGDHSGDWLGKVIASIEEHRLEESFFVAGAPQQVSSFLELCPVRSNFECAHGPGGRLVGWLHPRFRALRAGFSGVELNANALRPDPEFNQLVAQLRDLAVKTRMNEIPAATAHLISEVAGQPLLARLQSRLFSCAELACFFDEVPSPLLWRGRSVAFLKVWKARQLDRKATTQIGDDIVPMSAQFRVTYEISQGASDQDYILVYLSCTPDSLVSTSQWLRDHTEAARSAFSATKDALESALSSPLTSATGEWRRSEIGLVW